MPGRLGASVLPPPAQGNREPLHIKAVLYAVWGNRGLGKTIVSVDSAP